MPHALTFSIPLDDLLTDPAAATAEIRAIADSLERQMVPAAVGPSPSWREGGRLREQLESDIEDAIRANAHSETRASPAAAIAIIAAEAAVARLRPEIEPVDIVFDRPPGPGCVAPEAAKGIRTIASALRAPSLVEALDRLPDVAAGAVLNSPGLLERIADDLDERAAGHLNETELPDGTGVGVGEWINVDGRSRLRIDVPSRTIRRSGGR